MVLLFTHKVLNTSTYVQVVVNIQEVLSYSRPISGRANINNIAEACILEDAFYARK